MTTAKEATALLTYFKKVYKKKHGTLPKINSYADKWGMIDTIDDHGTETTKEIIDYYISVGDNHYIKDFFRRSDAIRAGMEESKRDREYRQRLMQETKERVEREKSE